MRFSKRAASASGPVTYALYPEDAEDVWTLYNLIEPGDEVRGAALRKVVRAGGADGGGGGGGGDVSRVHTRLTVRVLSASFDAEAGALRVAGRVCAENVHARLGAHQSLDVWPRAAGGVEVTKPAGWDSVALRRLHEAADAARTAEVAAILLDGAGRACVCLITDRLTLVRAKVDVPIPRKRATGGDSGGGGGGGGGARAKGQARFFEAVLAAALRAIDWAAVKAVLVASPGFVKDDWLRWALAEAGRRPEVRPLADARAKLLLAHCASGHARALAAVFADPAVASRLAGTRAAAEVAALAGFWDALRADDARAFYGYRHVRLAADRAAVARLLLSDALFRHAPPDVRRDYVALADAVAAAGGEVLIFSSMHGAGEQLSQMTGVAALCRFPLYDADEASAPYAARAAAHARAGRPAAAGAAAADAGAGADGDGSDSDDGEATGSKTRFHGAAAFSAGLFDSDASSDSDASYKHR